MLVDLRSQRVILGNHATLATIVDRICCACGATENFMCHIFDVEIFEKAFPGRLARLRGGEPWDADRYTIRRQGESRA